MFLAEGRNFADKGLTGNRRSYGQNIRRNEIDSNEAHNLQAEKGDIDES